MHSDVRDSNRNRCGDGRSERCARAVWLLIGTLIGTVPVGALAGQTPAQKCAIAKSKAAVVKLGAKMKCDQKAIAGGVAVDPACLTAAETKFDTAITKSEQGGGCVVTGDGMAIERQVDACFDALVALMSPVPLPVLPAQKCAVAKSKAAAKKFAKKIKCYQKAFIASGAVDPACLTAIETKFDAAIAKAEQPGGCFIVGDGANIETVVDGCVVAFAGLLLTPATTTTTTNATPTTILYSCGGAVCGGTCPSGYTCAPDPVVPQCGCFGGTCGSGPVCGTNGCASGGRCVSDLGLCLCVYP